MQIFRFKNVKMTFSSGLSHQVSRRQLLDLRQAAENNLGQSGIGIHRVQQFETIARPSARERVVGLMCLRHDRPRPVGKGRIILSKTIANSLNFSKFRSYRS